MAGDWIKMRVSLAKDPAVIAMADYLAEQRVFMDWLTDPVRRHCDKSAYEHVTRNVTVAVTVSALLVFWGVANEVGKPDGDDIVLRHATLESVNGASGVPCFGDAMAHVEWAVEEENNGKSRVRLPKFLINNIPAEDRGKKGNADRQRRFREKKALLGNADSNVTDNVTVTHREEKRREEKKEQKLSPPTVVGADRFQEFWAAYPNKTARKLCHAKWMKRKLDAMADAIIADVKAKAENDRRWIDGYVPNPETYLNQDRWDDPVQTRTNGRAADNGLPDFMVGAI